MREFVVSEAPVSRVTEHVRGTVEEAGGIVAHHTAHKTEFDHLDFGDQAWRRAGYVGTYQRFKEKPVQVRIRVWAQWPRRLLVSSIYIGFAVALLFFAASIVGLAIPPNAWIFTAGPILAAVAIALLMYTSSTGDSEGAERRIEHQLVERLEADDEIAGQIFDVDDWEDYRETVIAEAREEAEAAEPGKSSAIAQAAATAKGSLTSAETEAPDEAEDDEGFLAGVTSRFGDDANGPDVEDEAEEEPEDLEDASPKEAPEEGDDEEAADEEGFLAGVTDRFGDDGEDDEDAA